MFYTTKQIAELCGVHITTAIRWIDQGELQAYRTPGGRRRVAANELQSFVARLNIPVRGWPGRERPVVLVVDDDLMVMRALVRKLKALQRYEVVAASSAYEALLLVGAIRPDVVVLDLLMPTMDGFEVCAAIKRTPATRHVTIVAMTGQFSDGMRQRALDLGALECLPKVGGLDELPRLIDRAVARPTVW